MFKFLSNKKAKRIGAAALGAVVAVGATVGIGFSTGLFGSSSNDLADTGSGFIISGTQNHGVKLSSVAVSAEGEEYESCYEVTATADGTNTTIDLSVEFGTTTGNWGATQGSVSDYITLSSDTVESGGSFYVYCYAPFGTQIILTGSVDDAEGTCTLDYAAKYESSAFCCNGVVAGDELFLDGTDYVGLTWESNSAFSTISGIEVYVVGELSSYTYTLIDSAVEGSFNVGLVDKESSNIYDFDLSSTFICENYRDSVIGFYSCYVLSMSINYSEMLGNLYGVDISESDLTTRKAAYDYYEALYEAGDAAFTLTIGFTGSQTGNSYYYEYDCMFDPNDLYSAASTVTFGDSNILF